MYQWKKIDNSKKIYFCFISLDTNRSDNFQFEIDANETPYSIYTHIVRIQKYGQKTFNSYVRV